MRWNMRALGWLVVAGCSVPALSLEGKSCPCTDDYTCDSMMKCRAKLDGGAKMDAAGPTCLGPAASGMLFADNFDTGTLTWTATSMWAEAGGKLVQSDTNDQLAYAFPSTVGTATRYRIVAKMTGTAGGMGMGIAFRVQNAQPKAQYDCLWEPGAGAGALILQSTNNGGTAMSLKTLTGISNPGIGATYTMEVLADSGSLKCCIDEVSAASIAVTSTTYPTGFPGLITNQMHASFDDFVVYSN